MTTQNIILQNGTLQGQLNSPGPTDQLLVICHGYKSSSAHPALVAASQGLNAKGYTTFTFNFSDTIGLDLPQQVNDLACIAKHFSSQYPRIVFVAASFSALSASIAAQRLGIYGLVTVNGFFGRRQLGRVFILTFLLFKALTLTSRLHKNIWDFYKREFQPHQIITPTLVIHAQKDTWVPITQSREFFKRLICPKQFAELANADHNLSTPESVNAVVNKVDEWLKSAKQTPHMQQGDLRGAEALNINTLKPEPPKPLRVHCHNNSRK